jgi:predicted nucleic-acid-binding protein
MIGADANILLRLLLNDDAAQVATVRARLANTLALREEVMIGPIALAETVWTLTHRLKVPTSALASAIRDLGATRPFRFFDGEVVDAALALFESGRAGFSDCLIRAMDQTAGCVQTLTFDRRALTLPGFVHP